MVVRAPRSLADALLSEISSHIMGTPICQVRARHLHQLDCISQCPQSLATNAKALPPLELARTDRTLALASDVVTSLSTPLRKLHRQ